MEVETKLHDCESGKTVTIIANPELERTSSFDRDAVPLVRTASTVSRGAEEIERRYKKWLRAETVGLSVVIIVVWGLLLFPVIFYHLPVNEHNNITAGMESCDMIRKNYVDTGSNGERGHQSMCAAPVKYTQTVCQEELKSLKTCLLEEGDRESVHPLIFKKNNIEAAKIALSYVDGDSSGLVSPECAAEVKPFLCLHLLGLCDTTEGVSYQPSASHCRNLRDNVCAKEWTTVSNLGQLLPDIPSLPNCDTELSDDSMPHYFDDGSGEFGSTSENSLISQQQNLTCSNITCQEGFYCKEDANNGNPLCSPSCRTWKQYPHAINIAQDVLVLMSACIGVVTGVGVLVVAGIRWKNVLVFPSSLMVYQTITLLVLAIFVIINYVDTSTLYCTSEDLFKSQKEATAFCIISGVIYYYGLLQLAVFWFCHVSFLFWKIRFPFRARSFQMANRIKYIHIAAITLCILIPFVPIIATMSQYAYGKSAAQAAKEGLGFGIARFPPIFCLGKDRDTTFYSLILPILIIMTVGIPMLITLFWIIHKQHGLFKARQSRNPYKIGTAERKILIAIVYYVILAGVALTTFTLVVQDTDKHSLALLRYFECESKGMDSNNPPCDPNTYIKLQHVALVSLTYILLGLFPVVDFVFVISVRELKQYVQKRCPCLFKTTYTMHQ